MNNFADRLLNSIKKKGNPCIIGLDPRLEKIPLCFSGDAENKIFEFNKTIIDSIKDLVPAIKIQIAFYEVHGVSGIRAFENTIKYAKAAGLLVVVDAKRNDIGSTAKAYAETYLGKTFDADAVTVSPYMGADSMMPFVEACKKYGKGIFILTKTSNSGSGDIQDKISNGESISESVAKIINELGKDLIGENGYSSVGAVVGATYPEQAVTLRKLMPHSIILVPGYGAQGGTASDTKPCFNEDTLGAIVHSSRGIIHSYTDINISKGDFIKLVTENTKNMISDINRVLI